MESDPIPSTSFDGSPEDTLSPRAQITALLQDVRGLAETELDYAKARLSYSGGIIRKAGIFALLALLFLSGAAIAMILGTLLILNSYFGPWVATLSVVLFFGIAALLCAMFARKTATQLSLSEAHDDR